MQGTSRPTRYYVLHDDAQLGANNIQLLTNALCYTYERCTRAVSIPAPVYYAHHICAQAKLRLDGSDDGWVQRQLVASVFVSL